MKTKLYTAAVLAFGMNSVMAATTILVANVNLATSQGLLITEPTGAVYAGGGSWGVGVFAPGTDFSAPAPSILAAFTQAGTTALFSATPGVIGALGGQSVTAELPTTVTGPFVGNPMFVMIGDSATLAGSTEYIVVNSGLNFVPEVEGVGGNITGFLFDGTVVRGFSTTVSGGALATDQFNDGPGIAFVPEPSAALLGLLGAVGLLRRRRN